MLKDYPKFKRNSIEEYYDNLSSSEKKIIIDYLEYRKARGLLSQEKLKDTRRYLIQIRFLIEKDFKKFNDLKELRSLLSVINTTSNLSDTTKNNLKIDLKNFFKFLFDDWSKRFHEFEDIRLNSNQRNERKINSNNILRKEDIEKIMKHETKIYWKSFFMTQYEAALRTKEVRYLKWSEIRFNVDEDISEISIYSTKTKKSRAVFVKESTFYLKKLKEETENLGIKSIYVFYGKTDVNKPIDKGTVSCWIRELSQRALGRKIWSYLLRHSRGTELYSLSKQGKISKDIAKDFMGHSEDMSEVYTHLDSKVIKEMLKNQVYKLEDIPEEKKHALEKEVQELRDLIESLNLNELSQEIKKIKTALKILQENKK